MKEETMYLVISVEDELPNDEGCYSVRLKGETVFARLDYTPFDTGVIEWLKPLTAIPITAEKLQAYEKCVEALEKIQKKLPDIDDNDYDPGDILMCIDNYVNKALSQLNKIK